MGSRVLILVRHGQYVTDEKKRRHGQLTALGRRQAKRTGKRLSEYEIDAVFHSDMPRAVETAQIVLEALGKVPCHSMKALRELMPPDPKRPGEKARPRRELAEVRKAVEVLKRKFFSAPRGNRNRVELIVAHGNLIRYLVRLAMGDRTMDWWRMGTSNCGMTMIVIRHGVPNCLFHYNDVGHLPKSMQSMM